MASRVSALSAAVLLAAVDVLYLVLIFSQEETDDLAVVSFVAGVLGLAALAALLAAATSGSVRRPLLGAAAAAVFVMAVLSGFSIGLLLVPPLFLLVYSVLN